VRKTEGFFHLLRNPTISIRRTTVSGSFLTSCSQNLSTVQSVFDELNGVLFIPCNIGPIFFRSEFLPGLRLWKQSGHLCQKQPSIQTAIFFFYINDIRFPRQVVMNPVPTDTPRVKHLPDLHFRTGFLPRIRDMLDFL